MAAEPTPPDGFDVPAPEPPTPIRSSEGRLILETVKNLGDEVHEVHQSQGRMLRELSETRSDVERLRGQVQQLEGTFNKRMDSMRPKVARAVEESERISEVPGLIDATVAQRLDARDLDRYRARDGERKTLKLEAYKVVIGVLLAGALGGAITIAWQAILFAAGHSVRVHAVGP